MARPLRPLLWIASSKRDYQAFPARVQDNLGFELFLAQTGQHPPSAKPMKGLGAGVFEIALPYRGDAFRAIYAVRIGADLWVVHAFQKKSTQGIKTPQREIDVIRERLKRLRESEK